MLGAKQVLSGIALFVGLSLPVLSSPFWTLAGVPDILVVGLLQVLFVALALALLHRQQPRY